MGVLVCLFLAASVQDMEPRRWTPLPVETHYAGIAYVYSTGDILVDPPLQVEDAQLDMHAVIPVYAHYFALGDMTARADLQLPLLRGKWNGLLQGVPRTVTRTGLGDPRVRLGMNFVGAPPLEAEAFEEHVRSHEIRTTAGAGVAVRVPLGEYNEDKLINLGDNRFEFEPQLGFVHTRGPWSFELTGSMFLFTTNDDFFQGNRLEKEPITAIEGHVVRTFEGGYWLSAGAAHGRGGETVLNGIDLGDTRSHLLYGLQAGFAILSLQGFRAGYIRAESLNSVGADIDNFYLSWSIRF